MNRNFVEMLSALSGAAAEFLVVGGWAVAAHGFPRYTGDFDIWVRADETNSRRVYGALQRFGAPLDQLLVEDLALPGVIFQIGLPPQRIDIITTLEGVSFEEAWPHRVMITLGGLDVPVIGLDALIENKRATARGKDLIDLEQLEEIRKRSSPS